PESRIRRTSSPSVVIARPIERTCARAGWPCPAICTPFEVFPVFSHRLSTSAASSLIGPLSAAVLPLLHGTTATVRSRAAHENHRYRLPCPPCPRPRHGRDLVG